MLGLMGRTVCYACATLRFCRRGSSKIFLARLPDRAASGSGQRGGGALSIAELVEAFTIDTDDQVLVKLAIILTDLAKAYRRMGSLQWLAPGAFHDEFHFEEHFKIHMYNHKNVMHKTKVGEAIEWVVRKTPKLPSGASKEFLGGTDRIDAYWATIRGCVGRKSVNTGLDMSQARAWL